jgi:hypothetical protein
LFSNKYTTKKIKIQEKVLVILAEEVGIEPNTLTSTLSLAKKHQPSQHHLPL